MLGHLRWFYGLGTRPLFRGDNTKPNTFVILDALLCNRHIYGKQKKEFLREFSFQLDIEDDGQIVNVEIVSGHARQLWNPMGQKSEHSRKNRLAGPLALGELDPPSSLFPPTPTLPFSLSLSNCASILAAQTSSWTPRCVLSSWLSIVCVPSEAERQGQTLTCFYHLCCQLLPTF